MNGIDRVNGKFYFFALLACFCLFSSVGIFALTQPQWAQSRPANTDQTLYGVGQGGTRQLAIESALVEIASTIRIDIKSNTNQTKTYANGKEQNVFNEKTSSEVARTQFSHYDVVQSEQVDKVTWVLVSVNRTRMSKDLLTKIDHLKTEVALRLKRFGQLSALEKSQTAPAIQELLAKLAGLIATESALDKNFDPKPQMTFVIEQENKLSNIKKNMVVKIEADTKLGSFANLLATYLTERDVKVVQDGSRNGKAVIAIHAAVNNKLIQNTYITKVEVKIDAINEQGTVLKSYMKTLNGASPSNFESALSQANQNLYNLFVKDNVIDSFGL